MCTRIKEGLHELIVPLKRESKDLTIVLQINAYN